MLAYQWGLRRSRQGNTNRLVARGTGIVRLANQLSKNLKRLDCDILCSKVRLRFFIGMLRAARSSVPRQATRGVREPLVLAYSVEKLCFDNCLLFICDLPPISYCIYEEVVQTL